MLHNIVILNLYEEIYKSYYNIIDASNWLKQTEYSKNKFIRKWKYDIFQDKSEGKGDIETIRIPGG